ncbi:BID domain-containing T4SS effector [Bartonella sp. AP58NXGY]|uniref:BID domain-containing T4SS effector n=1 Tax=Bartonella sp. AP58NXGY TaxID=3243498 RepID=UPI0035D0F379
MKKSHPQPAPQNPAPQKREALYANLSGSGNGSQGPLQQEASPYNKPRGKTNEQKNSPYNTQKESAYETPSSPQPLGTIYAPQYPLGATRAAVGRGPRDPSPENPSNPYAVVNLASGETEFQERINSLYNSPSGSSQDVRFSQEPEHLYAEPDFSENSGRSPHKPLESVYAKLGMGAEGGQEPQKPEHLYAEPDFSENSGRSPHKPLESVYAKLGMGAEGGQEPQEPEHLYAEPDFSENGGRSPHKPLESVDAKLGMETEGGQEPQEPEHLYAEPDFSENGGRSPHKPLESVDAKLGMETEGGQESQQRENPTYQGVGRAATPPPRTSKDVITTKLLQSREFQYGVRETQEWCAVVYGNPHALNKQFAQILEDPPNAEKVLWDLLEHPESPAKLAGRQVLGVKSSDRKAAEDGFSPLCSALERHIYNAQKLHKQFTREQERDQRQESPERDAGHKRHHHHRRHARGQNRESPEHSPQRQKHGEKGFSYAM